MWDKPEIKLQMQLLHEAHTYYLNHTLDAREQLFNEFMSNEGYVEKEKNIFLLNTKRRFYIDLPMIKIWEHEVSKPGDSVMNEISDSAGDYILRVNHNLENVKEKQRDVLAFICRKHKKIDESPFLFFCEEIKRWIIALPTVNDTNYNLVMGLIKTKESYIRRVIEGEIFYREEDFLFELLDHLKILKSIFFQNHTDQNIIQSLSDLEQKLYPMKREFLALLYFIFRRHSVSAQDYKDKNNLGKKIYDNFREQDLIKDEFDSYTSTFLNPMVEASDFADNKVISYDISLVFGRSEADFLIKLSTVEDALINRHDGNRGFIEEFKKAQSCFYNLHFAFIRFLKIHRAVQLLCTTAQRFGSIAFYTLLKDAVVYIFSEFDECSKETKRNLENIYDHLMQFYRGTRKGKDRVICLQASEYAKDRILNIIRSCELAKIELQAKISSYSYEMDIVDAYNDLIELVELCKAFGAPEDFYSNLSTPLEEYANLTISQNPMGFYNKSISVTEVNDDILLISNESSTQEIIEKCDGLLEYLRTGQRPFGES